MGINALTIVDLDKIVPRVHSASSRAIRNWLDGIPRDESAFMNNYTRHLKNLIRNADCDIGINTNIRVKADLFELHRRGSQQRDKYGSDFALTVRIPSIDFTKTALFQVKISRGYNVVLERRQLEEAIEDRLTKDRSFILAVDRTKRRIRLKQTNVIYQNFSEYKQSQTFNTTFWPGLTDFVREWLSCSWGPLSNPYGDIESKLERLKVNDSQEPDTLEDSLTVSNWLQFLLNEPEEDRD